jgi:16S rRNA (cytidine1402-2'-O)-methyltransferase
LNAQIYPPKPILLHKKHVEGKLYLLPNLLGDGDPNVILSANVIQIIKRLRYFIVEDIRTSRRFLSKVGMEVPIDALSFLTLNEHTTAKEIVGYLDPLAEGDMGILSDAGVPGVADPGADVVRLAHQKEIQVVPLVGPSSILMAVMAAGLNGQNFAFNGYLPVKRPERINKIKFFEKRVLQENQTQLFIEAPYRNNSLLEDIIATCAQYTMIGIAADISMETEFIQTKTVEAWRKKLPDLHKRPAIFMIGK